jgi:hypothetical protein
MVCRENLLHLIKLCRMDVSTIITQSQFIVSYYHGSNLKDFISYEDIMVEQSTM